MVLSFQMWMAEAQVPPLTITEERQLEIGCISINNVFAEAQLKKKKSFSDSISAGPYSSISAYSQGNESKRADSWLEPPEAFA